ncbi:MAG: cytochrome c peroxidase [Bacteroidota bacterium]
MKNTKQRFIPAYLASFLILSLSLISCEPETPDDIPCAERTWYQDADNDGLGNAAATQVACEQPTGYVSNADDDNDLCSSTIDECGICGGPGAATYYADNDNDGLGDPNNSVQECTQPTGYVSNSDDLNDDLDNSVSAIERVFGGRIDLDNLLNYSNQAVPNYINEDNTGNNPITDGGATLGRVLFYDVNLSVDNTIACASCHQQAAGFSDRSLLSQGVAGVTGRHSMRLINARFAEEDHFFWDERANTLEEQTTQPIQDHIEMGFSGQNGDPSIDDLIAKLEALDYYQELFTFVYGQDEITEEKMQMALAQFVRSIQSFDSRYDQGRGQVNNGNANFPNFTAEENAGKRLFMTPPNQGGAGCAGCHRAPEFDIDPNSRNNGVVGVAGNPGMIDITITRSPTLRDMVDPNGVLNGALMHDGSLMTLADVIDHYNEVNVVQGNNNLDPRLRGGAGGQGQNLNLTDNEKNSIVAFLETLSGNNVYRDVRWSNPFQ